MIFQLRVVGRSRYSNLSTSEWLSFLLSHSGSKRSSGSSTGLLSGILLQIFWLASYSFTIKPKKVYICFPSGYSTPKRSPGYSAKASCPHGHQAPTQRANIPQFRSISQIICGIHISFQEYSAIKAAPSNLAVPLMLSLPEAPFQREGRRHPAWHNRRGFGKGVTA